MSTNVREVLRPDFEKRGGLVTVVAQDINTGTILMVAYTDLAGFEETLKTGEAVYYSTSRNKRWKKGEESGDVQKVAEVLIDCDGDALVYVVEQCGDGACHTKAKSCFYRNVDGRIIMEAPKAGQKENLPLMKVEVSSEIEDGELERRIEEDFFARAKKLGIPDDLAREFFYAGR